MNDSELGAAYRQAFTDTEDEAVRRMRDFVDTLPSARGPLLRRARWILPAGVAAAVAAVAVATVAMAAGGSHPVRSAGGGPVITARSSAHPSPPRTPRPRQTPDTTIYPPIGDPGITGPLAPYAEASAYTEVPAGLAVRKYADDVFTPDGVARRFQMYICKPNEEPKVVAGGYLVVVTAPSYRFESMDGEGPSLTPAGVAIHLGNRSWHWNTDHTVLISTGPDADLYIGVLAVRANNEFEPTIPTGYSAADIELIAAGLRG